MNSSNWRGQEREKRLDKSHYFSDGYFSLPQLCSYAHQINDIWGMRPSSIIEVGIGNGFTSAYLRAAGFDVTTSDINRSLNPDIVSPVDQLEKHLDGKRFGLLVCCEVLEHIPFDEFHHSIESFRSISDNLYLTLPSYKRAYGLGGLTKLPKLGAFKSSFYFCLPGVRELDAEHFWEIDFSRETSLKVIKQTLKQHFSHIEVSRFEFNPYHMCFKCFA